MHSPTNCLVLTSPDPCDHLAPPVKNQRTPLSSPSPLSRRPTQDAEVEQQVGHLLVGALFLLGGGGRLERDLCRPVQSQYVGVTVLWAAGTGSAKPFVPKVFPQRLVCLSERTITHQSTLRRLETYYTTNLVPHL